MPIVEAGAVRGVIPCFPPQEVVMVKRTDVAESPCPSCGAVGTLRHDPSRRWRMESVAPIGGGWYVPCRSVEDWRAVRARRGRVPVVAVVRSVVATV